MNALTASAIANRHQTLTEWRVEGETSTNLGTLADVILHADGVLTITVRGMRLHVGPGGDLIVIGEGDGDNLIVGRTTLPTFAGGGDRLVITKAE